MGIQTQNKRMEKVENWIYSHWNKWFDHFTLHMFISDHKYKLLKRSFVWINLTAVGSSVNRLVWLDRWFIFTIKLYTNCLSYKIKIFYLYLYLFHAFFVFDRLSDPAIIATVSSMIVLLYLSISERARSFIFVSILEFRQWSASYNSRAIGSCAW